jgi:hypothetical protein
VVYDEVELWWRHTAVFNVDFVSGGCVHTRYYNTEYSNSKNAASYNTEYSNSKNTASGLKHDFPSMPQFPDESIAALQPPHNTLDQRTVLLLVRGFGIALSAVKLERLLLKQRLVYCTVQHSTRPASPVAWKGVFWSLSLPYRFCANAMKPKLAWIASLRYRIRKTVHNELGTEIRAQARIMYIKTKSKKLYYTSNDTAEYTIHYFPSISVEKTFSDAWY